MVGFSAFDVVVATVTGSTLTVAVVANGFCLVFDSSMSLCRKQKRNREFQPQFLHHTKQFVFKLLFFFFQNICFSQMLMTSLLFRLLCYLMIA